MIAYRAIVVDHDKPRDENVTEFATFDRRKIVHFLRLVALARRNGAHLTTSIAVSQR